MSFGQKVAAKRRNLGRDFCCLNGRHIPLETLQWFLSLAPVLSRAGAGKKRAETTTVMTLRSLLGRNVIIDDGR